MIRIVTDKLTKPTASTPQASGDWAAAKATYRIFASHQVRADAMRAPHRDTTVQRILHHATILVLQDTTELDDTGHPNTTIPSGRGSRSLWAWPRPSMGCPGLAASGGLDA